ncbi:hypothetical protein H5410_033440 [Solanum commersonii]|uniref:Uncharacterized protein n=1 Tax=Solanum commersonii TaxID=4109 RepID=A0A9J5YT46_SOLCO|nr:hypothetical protein H5410_033440 [Solanum commersonii]
MLSFCSGQLVPHRKKLRKRQQRTESIKVACYLGSRASPMRCTTARAWRTPPNLVQFSWRLTVRD